MTVIMVDRTVKWVYRQVKGSTEYGLIIIIYPNKLERLFGRHINRQTHRPTTRGHILIYKLINIEI